MENNQEVQLLLSTYTPEQLARAVIVLRDEILRVILTTDRITHKMEGEPFQWQK